jgi:hypothetical protein
MNKLGISHLLSLPSHPAHKQGCISGGWASVLHVRLQLILQLIMQQSLWLIKSKQRAFNPIHRFFFFSTMSSLSNTIRFRMQSREEAGIGPTCLAGLQAGSSKSENSWLRRWQRWRLGGKPLSDWSTAQGRDHLGVTGRETLLMPLDLAQSMGENWEREDTNIDNTASCVIAT